MIDTEGKAKMWIPEGTEFMIPGTVHCDPTVKANQQFALPMQIQESAQRMKAAILDDKKKRKSVDDLAEAGAAKRAKKTQVKILKVTVMTPSLCETLGMFYLLITV